MEMKLLKIHEIAEIIGKDWPNMYFGARPYHRAMYHLATINDSYGLDDGRGIVLYFLSNASTWRGETARQIKAELKRRIK